MKIYRNRQEEYPSLRDQPNKLFYIDNDPSWTRGPKRAELLLGIEEFYGTEMMARVAAEGKVPENKDQDFVLDGGNFSSGEDGVGLPDGSLPTPPDIYAILARIEAKIDKLFIKVDDGPPPAEMNLYSVRYAQFATDPNG